MSSTTKIKPSYERLRCLYIDTDVLAQGQLQQGRVAVLLEGDPDFALDGKLNAQGLLSGMAKLYRRLGLKIGDVVEYSVTKTNVLTVHQRASAQGAASPVPIILGGTVFERKGLKHIHIELFRAENLNHWEPETETDLYLAFGVLQEFTDFQYCCGASISLLDRLGYKAETKPDAIVIDRTTEQYLMAEWKKSSTDFKSNHKPEDVDLLVCWIDDETERAVLPPKVLALRDVALTAAETLLNESDAGA